MVKDIYNQICSGTEIRSNLIALKNQIKNQDQKRILAYELAGDYSNISDLLTHEEPKVRKNAALILGEMEDEELITVLLQAYEKENTRFVRSSYLKAISNYDYEKYLPRLQERAKELEEERPEESNEKHRREELLILRTMILRFEKPKKHVFHGYEEEVEVILLTNRNHREVTRRQIAADEVKMLAGGMRFRTNRLKDILPIRTYSELLFPIKKTGLLSCVPEEMAKQLAESDLLSMLKRMHKGNPPFYYRVELKSKMTLEKKSDFLKKMTGKLEELTNQSLMNTTSDYEVEIRLIENREGKFLPLLKLYTLPDLRFAYRKNVLSTSITPVNAALCMQLAGEYLTEGAQVLDPFCGTGTMLIERKRYQEASPLYGIDIFEDAIIKGRENAEAAEVLIHFINRNFFDFKHEYLFDEIVSNLPGITRTKDKGEILSLYEQFFEKSLEVLKPDGMILLYSSEPDLIEYCMKETEKLQIREQWRIQDKEEGTLFVIKEKKSDV